jgi:hypothetical protein
MYCESFTATRQCCRLVVSMRSTRYMRGGFKSAVANTFRACYVTVPVVIAAARPPNIMYTGYTGNSLSLFFKLQCVAGGTHMTATILTPSRNHCDIKLMGGHSFVIQGVKTRKVLLRAGGHAHYTKARPRLLVTENRSFEKGRTKATNGAN